MSVALALFVLLVLLSQSALDPTFVYDKAEYLLRPYDFKGLLKVGVYLSTYALAVIALYAIIVSRSNIWFIVLIALATVFAGTNHFYQLLGSPIGFTSEELELIIRETGQAGNALSTYLDLLLKTLGFSAVVLLIACLVRYLLEVRISSWWLLVVPLSIGATLFATRKVGDNHIFYYPPLQNVGATLTKRLVLERDGLAFFERDEVTAPASNLDAQAEHILFVIDESVNGRYLSINGYERDTTPLLSSMLESRDDIVNFGVATAVSNVSGWANLILRIGLLPAETAEFEERITRLPTIFQYAKNAGYETLLIEGQAQLGQLQNYLTHFDRRFIDDIWYKGNDELKYERDVNLLEKYLQKIDQSEGKTFAVFIRTGSHWPWADKYPISEELFIPAQRTTFGGMTPEMKDIVTNTYLNTIRFNVDNFLSKAIDALLSRGVWTVYTSDHGVSIFEDGTPRTHGSTDNVPLGQFMVPLMIFGSDSSREFAVAEGDRYSHFQIFPTLLLKMGYGPDFVENFGRSLHEPWPEGEPRSGYIMGGNKTVLFDQE